MSFPFVVEGRYLAGWQVTHHHFTQLWRFRLGQVALTIDVVVFRSELTVAIDQLVAGNFGQIHHQMFGGFDSGDSVDIRKKNTPHRLHTIIGSVENPHFPAAKTSADGSGYVLAIAVDYLLGRSDVAIAESLHERFEVVQPVCHEDSLAVRLLTFARVRLSGIEGQLFNPIESNDLRKC